MYKQPSFSYDIERKLFHSVRQLSLGNYSGLKNIKGNEITDSLARDGITNPFIGLTYGIHRRIIRDYFILQHKSIRPNSHNCKHIRTLCKKQSFYSVESRNDLRLIIGAITSHCTLNKHLQKTV